MHSPVGGKWGKTCVERDIPKGSSYACQMHLRRSGVWDWKPSHRPHDLEGHQWPRGAVSGRWKRGWSRVRNAGR